MATYRVTNRITKETQNVDAPCAQDACRMLGWMIGNCHVKLTVGGMIWTQVPDVIEDDGERLGTHYVLKEYP